jgi:hypothetical protein
MSYSAFQNAHQAPSEAVDRAFMKTLETHSSRLFKLLTFPLDVLIACKDALFNVFLFPFRLMSQGLAKLGKAGERARDLIQDWLFWLVNLPTQIFAWLFGGLGSYFQRTCTTFAGQVNTLKMNISTSFIWTLFSNSSRTVSGFFSRIRVSWIVFNSRLADGAILVEDSIVHCFKNVQSAMDNVSTKWNSIKECKKDSGDRLRSGYNNLNRSLADWALSVEDFLMQITTSFRDLKLR